MFASMAEVFGAGAVAVVLTGMGRDGTAGARRIVEAGGWVVAQDAESSVVWGMPGSVAREGLASAILPPDRMGRYFASQMARAACQPRHSPALCAFLPGGSHSGPARSWP